MIDPLPHGVPPASDAGLSARGWLWRAMAPERWTYAQVIVAAVVANLLTVAISLFTMVVYDRILPAGARESLLALTVGVVLAVVFDFVLRSLRSAFIDRAGREADLRIGEALFDRLAGMTMAARKSSSGGTAAAMREVEVLRDFLTSSTLVILVDLPFAGFFLVATFLLGGALVAIPLIGMGAVLLACLWMVPRMHRFAEGILAEGKGKHGVLFEFLHGIETIKALGAEGALRARWRQGLVRQADYGLRSRALMQAAIHISASAQQLVQVGLVVVGALLVMAGQVTAGGLIACVILAGRAMAPLAQATQLLTRFHQARAAWQGLNLIMQSPTEGAAMGPHLRRADLQGDLSFEDVSFRYPGAAEPALDGVSFAIRPGERVAILGRIGSGKSTVLRLLLGFYPPDSGAILLDGTDLRQIAPEDVRATFAAVLQEGWLVSGTLRDNIALAQPAATDAEVLAAARVAGVDSFAARHPEGYGRLLSEGGRELSGGQRQAVALARALLRRAPLLLLDEPTAAMDVETEAALIQRLRHDADVGARGVILVTHRTSLLALVDRVLVLDQGRVVLDGPVAALTRHAVARAAAETARAEV